MAINNDKIKKMMMSAMKTEVEKAARRMMEWDAEDYSGWKCVDSIK